MKELVGFRGARLGVLAVLVVGCVSVLVGSAAAETSPACATAGGVRTCTFSYTGAVQTFAVPAGVTQATITVVGAPGGIGGSAVGSPKAPGGRGARVQATLSLTPLSTVNVVVGGPGGSGGTEAGGFNGGGAGQNSGGSPTVSGGGGGATDIRIGGADLAHRVMVAGGGGGGGGNGLLGGSPIDQGNIPGGTGGDAGSNGTAGTGFTGALGPVGGGSEGTGASGASAGIGGAGGFGDAFGGSSGVDGGVGRGGESGQGSIGTGGDGGGGGGGYRGGGGGGGGSDDFETGTGGGGGGGGSSLVPAGGTSALDASGVPRVLIAYSDQSTPTAPVTTITLAPSAPNGNNGWYTSTVGISVAAGDGGGSAVTTTRCALDPVSVPATFSSLPPGPCAIASVTTAGSHTIYAASTNLNGNDETPVSASLRIDKTVPALAPVVSPNPIALGGPTSVMPHATDTGGSGVAGSVCGALDTSSVGDHAVTCHAADNAGNTNSATVHYLVAHAFGGFQSPLPKDNAVKSGSTIPVKFSLVGITATRALASAGEVKITLAGPGLDPLSAVCDAQGGSFHCNLKTPKGLDTGDPGYTITAYEDLGSGFVAVPSSSAGANPVVVHFK